MATLPAFYLAFPFICVGFGRVLFGIDNSPVASFACIALMSGVVSAKTTFKVIGMTCVELVKRFRVKYIKEIHILRYKNKRNV